MGWLGMIIGSYLGGRIGHIPGALIGSLLGHKAENFIRGQKKRIDAASLNAGERSKIFTATVAALLAKIAKADGVVSHAEIERVERAFIRLGFTEASRQYAIDVFQRTKNDRHSIDDYARDFAAIVSSVEVRELMYEILWEVACADGTLSGTEHQMLRRLPAALGIRASWYDIFAAHYIGQHSGAPASGRAALAEAYSVLGASPNDDAETLKQKYRVLAKKNHPDALRAQGLPDEMIGKATERMSRINAAWNAVREARGL